MSESKIDSIGTVGSVKDAIANLIVAIISGITVLMFLIAVTASSIVITRYKIVMITVLIAYVF